MSEKRELFTVFISEICALQMLRQWLKPGVKSFSFQTWSFFDHFLLESLLHVLPFLWFCIILTNSVVSVILIS